MFDFIKKMFGESFIYADIECKDGTSGRVKMNYIGDPSTLDKQEYINRVKNEIWFKHGKIVTEVNNIRFS